MNLIAELKKLDAEATKGECVATSNLLTPYIQLMIGAKRIGKLVKSGDEERANALLCAAILTHRSKLIAMLEAGEFLAAGVEQYINAPCQVRGKLYREVLERLYAYRDAAKEGA